MHGKQYERQKDTTLKDELPMSLVPNMKSGEIAPEGMKRLSQSRDDAQLWMSGGESKVSRCKQQYCIGTWNVRP